MRFALTLKTNRWRGLIALAPILIPLTAQSAPATPVQPAPQTVVLTLPGDAGTDATLQALQVQYRGQADDTTVVAALVRHYLTQAEIDADPRMAGQASALLAKQKVLTPELLALDARRLAFEHDFVTALSQLDRAIQSQADDIELRLQRATYRLLQADTQGAAADCRHISAHGDSMLGAFCQTQIIAQQGEPGRAKALQAELAPRLQGDTALRTWVETVRAETAWMDGDLASAETHFLKAYQLQEDHAYTRRRLADIAISQSRFDDARALVDIDSPVDALLLRATHAALLSGDKHTAADGIRQYRQRRDAMLQSKRPLQPADEAYFFTHIEPDPEAALSAARANWDTQKSREDWQLLNDAAAMSHQREALMPAPAWATTSPVVAQFDKEYAQ